MDGMLVLGLIFGFFFGMAVALLIAGVLAKRERRDLHEHVRKGLGKLVSQMKSVENNDAVHLYTMALERWIPRNARPWPPCLWPDPPPSKRPKPGETLVGEKKHRPRPWPPPPPGIDYEGENE